MQFKNQANDYVEESTLPWLWAFIFGPLYFAYKGVWRHFFIMFTLSFISLLTFYFALLLLPFIAFCYAVYAGDIIRTHYLRKGWVEIQAQSPSS